MTKDITKVEDNSNKVFAVDGDIIAYRTAAVCEEHFEGACESIIDTTLTEIATDTGITNMRIYVSGENNFRKKIAVTKPYKGNRATMVAPRFLNFCKSYLVDKYHAIRMHGYEADDGIASDMVQNGAIHCGIDKDIKQIQGKHYNYVNKEWDTISEDQARLNLFRQVLTGDISDNIPGLPRVGVKTAEKIITEPETALADAIEYYKEICSDKLPDIDPIIYFVEQRALIEMIKDINLYNIFMCQVERETDGFVKLDPNSLKGGISVKL